MHLARQKITLSAAHHARVGKQDGDENETENKEKRRGKREDMAGEGKRRGKYGPPA
jgi:hypothetical protein